MNSFQFGGFLFLCFLWFIQIGLGSAGSVLYLDLVPWDQPSWHLATSGPYTLGEALTHYERTCPNRYEAFAHRVRPLCHDLRNTGSQAMEWCIQSVYAAGFQRRSNSLKGKWSYELELESCRDVLVLQS